MEQKKRGRPPKQDPKTQKILIACSLAEKAKIVKAAENAGLSISSYVLKKII